MGHLQFYSKRIQLVFVILLIVFSLGSLNKLHSGITLVNPNLNQSNNYVVFTGESPGQLAGYSVSGVGDVNNDGYDDFIISAASYPTLYDYQTKTYLILGGSNINTSSSLNLVQANASYIGESLYQITDAGSYYTIQIVSGVGDVNNDGYDDFIIGADQNTEGGSKAGQVYLIFGRPTNQWTLDVSLANSNASFIGSPGEQLGMAVNGVGDVNHDNFDDFIIGAPANSDESSYGGKVYLILGRATNWVMDSSLSTSANASFYGEHAMDNLGIHNTGVGDVNNDGYDDFLLTSGPNSDAGYQFGQTYLFLGKDSWTSNLNVSLAANASYLGVSTTDSSTRMPVAGLGDFNGDGYDDFAISNPVDGNGKISVIYGSSVISGMNQNLNQASTSFEGLSGDCAGASIAGIGDINIDGYDDFITGSPCTSVYGNYAGKLYIILGSNQWGINTSLSFASKTIFGSEAGNYAGMAASGVGHVNDDIYPDFIIGIMISPAATMNGEVYLFFEAVDPNIKPVTETVTSTQYSTITSEHTETTNITVPTPTTVTSVVTLQATEEKTVTDSQLSVNFISIVWAFIPIAVLHMRSKLKG